MTPSRERERIQDPSAIVLGEQGVSAALTSTQQRRSLGRIDSLGDLDGSVGPQSAVLCVTTVTGDTVDLLVAAGAKVSAAAGGAFVAAEQASESERSAISIEVLNPSLTQRMHSLVSVLS